MVFANYGVIVVNVYSRRMGLFREVRLWFDGGSDAVFSRSDLQILRSSLIIIGLFGDAARFRCGNSCSKFVCSVDRIPIDP